ncbi:HNH endonuclease [Paenibacillus rhizolycopersici]|nr:HNH endonuclease [Paenibacillus rhizolycopersici]
MVINIDKSHIQLLLAELYGIDFSVSEGDGYINLRPADLALGEGFVIRINFSWRSLVCEFLPDNYAAALIRAMGNASEAQKELFRSLYDSIRKRSSVHCEIAINKSFVDPEKAWEWPSTWRNFQLSLKVMPFIFENMEPSEYDQVIVQWGGIMISLILPLIPMEAEEEELFEGVMEGSLSRIEVNKYERNLINRQACLLIHGTDCMVCGFSFESKYGPIGKEFIHVHHLTPVSVLGENYRINPAKDLVPVCPNCHAMLHKRNPPFTVEELAKIIEEHN